MGNFVRQFFFVDSFICQSVGSSMDNVKLLRLKRLFEYCFIIWAYHSVHLLSFHDPRDEPPIKIVQVFWSGCRVVRGCV